MIAIGGEDDLGIIFTRFEEEAVRRSHRHVQWKPMFWAGLFCRYNLCKPGLTVEHEEEIATRLPAEIRDGGFIESPLSYRVAPVKEHEEESRSTARKIWVTGLRVNKQPSANHCRGMGMGWNSDSPQSALVLLSACHHLQVA